ncbi:unnamed protein product [Fraxinus pennsylvanica]|uniref:Uncharacterized protein n=1 Tax=Fraxinus pennsylvanica TaxID=56036 RepID=A0AAD2ED39_9LAMI|nr:unnamed protein product [Fraxinus pennsylvanica]
MVCVRKRFGETSGYTVRKGLLSVCLVSKDEEIKRRVSKCKEVQLSYFLLGIVALYLTIYLKFPEFFETVEVLSGDDSDLGIYDLFIGNDEDKEINATVKPRQEASPEEKDGARRIKPIQHQYVSLVCKGVHGVLGYVMDDGDNGGGTDGAADDM